MPVKRKYTETTTYKSKKFRRNAPTRKAWSVKRKNIATSKFAKAVKDVMLKETETKYVCINRALTGTAGNGTLCHNLLTQSILWDDINNTSLFPSQGDGKTSRDGEEIFCRGFMLRGVFQIPYNRRNMRFKLWYVPYNSQQGSPTDKSQFFYSTVNNTLLDPVQTDRWKGIRYLGTYKCSAVDQTTGSEDKTIMVKKWIPINRKLVFRTSSDRVVISGLKENGTIIIAPYDTVTSASTDVLITRMEASVTMYYKDL